MPRPRSAWAAGPRIDELARTSAQRRADALVEMADPQRAAPPPRASAPPRSSAVFVGYETMHGRICELENGTVLAPVGPRPRGWTRPTSSGPSSRWATASTSACGPGSSPGDPTGHRAPRPHLHPPALLRAGRELPGRPHPDLRRGRPRPPRTTADCSAASTTACATSESNDGEQRQRPTAERRLRAAGAGDTLPPWSHPGRPRPALRRRSTAARPL